MTGPDTNTQGTRPLVTTHPLLGVAGVLLGALIATCTGRLMSVGLADIRGALHLGVDEGSWINTAFNASMVFIGPFSVYLGGLLGPRRVLLACAWIFTVVSFLIGVACLLDARVTSVWAGPNFGISQAVMAVGLAMAFNSMVGAIVLEIIDTGGLTRPADALTFAGCYQVTHLFGGEMGSTFMGHFIAVREEFHSNMLGLNVQLGNSLTDSKLLGLRHAFAPHSTGLTAMGRAAEVLGLQVRQKAYTLAISDSFLLQATCCVACLVVVSFMSKVPTQYRQVTAAPVEAK
jgi:MFS family permease